MADDEQQHPVCAGKEPIEVELEAGTYWWCACGRSQSQPFCDGSHAGTGIEPHEMTVAEKQRLWLCNCKATGKAPFCDGSHARLGDD